MSNATVLAAPAATPHIAEPATCIHCPQPSTDYSSLCRDCYDVAGQIEAAFPLPRWNWHDGAQVDCGALRLLIDPDSDPNDPQVIAWGIVDVCALRPMTIAEARRQGEAAMEECPRECQDDAYEAIREWHQERLI